jgi:glycerol-3-phosphate acyltransferase PlsY
VAARRGTGILARMHLGTPGAEIAAALLAYAIGGIPFGWLAARLVKGVDLRKVGSGNIGATNTSRLWTKGNSVLAFACVFLLDCFKGFCAANWAGNLGDWLQASTVPETLDMICGASAILGHVFTPYLGFKGGKGVATALGVVTALAPWSSLYALGAWGLLVGLTRYMSMGSIAAMLSIPVTYFLRNGPDTFRGRLGVFVFLSLTAIVVVWRHRANLVRIFQGRERRVGAADQQL